MRQSIPRYHTPARIRKGHLQLIKQGRRAGDLSVRVENGDKVKIAVLFQAFCFIQTAVPLIFGREITALFIAIQNASRAVGHLI